MSWGFETILENSFNDTIKDKNFSSACTHKERHITYLSLSERSSFHPDNEKVGSLIHARSHRNTLNEKHLNQDWSLRWQNIHYHFFDGITPGIYATKTTRTSEGIFRVGGPYVKDMSPNDESYSMVKACPFQKS
jgi:hypothetical protein